MTYRDQTPSERAQHARALRSIHVPKFVITDGQGTAVAGVIFCSDEFRYDRETDSFVWSAGHDGRQLFSVFTEAEPLMKSRTNNGTRYLDINVSAPRW